LHVAGQKNLSFFSVPGWTFLHLPVGFAATYGSHDWFALPSNRNESKFSHGPRLTVGEDVGESAPLHSFLHVAGQKNLSFFSVPGWTFLHLLTGLIATYKSHVLDELPSNLKSRSFEQSMGGTALGAEVTSSRGFLHSVSHVPGQNFLTVFPPDSGCIFSHLLTGLIATYKSHVLDELPSNLKSRSFEQSMMSASPSPAAIGRTIASVRRWSAAPSLTPFCTDRFFRDEMKLAWRISLTRRMVREEELPLRAARGRVNEVMSDLAGVGAAVGTALAALTRMGTRKALIYAKESFIMTTSFVML
jgi:hypothetical protein